MIETIDNIKKIIVEFRRSWKEFFLGFSLGIIIALCMGFWLFFTTFNVVINAPKDVPILDYITIALTLFGFTLVGGIFEKKNLHELPKIAKSLFKDSLIFLSSGTSFLLAYASSFFISPLFINNNSWKIIFQIAYIVGAITFAIAIGRLLVDLFIFYLNLDSKT
jgi:hypothetical protein